MRTVVWKISRWKWGDGSKSIFLSTEGKDTDKIPKELRAFLEFVKTDNPKNNMETDDEYVKELQRTIRSIKESRTLERSFMTWEDIRRDARLEGKLETQWENIMDFLEELGTVPEDIESSIMSETREPVLRSMLKAASRVTSFEEFKEKISNL